MKDNNLKNVNQIPFLKNNISSTPHWYATSYPLEWLKSKRRVITSIKEMGIPDHLTCLLRNLYAGQEATVRTGHGKQTGSKSGKEYNKAVYCHPAYLTYMQSTLCKMLDWMKHKLESRLPGERAITSDRRMIPHLWRKAKKN